MACLNEEIRIFGSSLAIMLAMAAVALGGYVWLAPPGSLAPHDPLFAGAPIRIELPSAIPITDEEAEQQLSAVTTLPADTILLLSGAEPQVSTGDSARSEQFTALDDETLRADFARVPALTPAEGREGRLLAVEFDLTDPYARTDDGGSAIEIRKTLRFNGVDVGPAAIRVSAGSTLSIAHDDLGGLLERAGRGDVAEQLRGVRSGGFVSFDEMRRQGIEVRYDAPSDRVLLAI